ncbi:MAG: sugar-binding domain-containing protein [Bifidobacterium tsurumiense]|uniref:sugar-binding transcriptional regulator n=1 Tax=Bifidobacterium tsurumiense TaxID=356829 RepID=UPI002A7FE095|nr:sugar-binding domain-containing protein [Bifidobacterium tsurumiense]MDY4678460.1 sugar-binding domain-containing protein [Bifidobacterium tsurumiense]
MLNDDILLATQESRKHVELVLHVAREYYLEDHSQAQIAKSIGYSRPSVSRLLKEARERGMVHITIGHSLERMQALERKIQQRFGLKHVRVAEVRPGEDPGVVVPRYAAALFTEICTPDSLITVSNGRVVANTVREIMPQNWPETNVTQMIGTLSPDNPMTDSPDICRMLADRLGGTYTLLPCPMVLSSRDTASVMRKEPQIATAIKLGGGADVAIVGVGATTSERSGHIFDAYVDKRMSEHIQALGAVGHICGHHIDVHGNHVRTPLCDRTISVDLERLRKIPNVIGVAVGKRKVEAIRACLNGSLLSSLVTDHETAQLLAETA